MFIRFELYNENTNDYLEYVSLRAVSYTHLDVYKRQIIYYSLFDYVDIIV